MGKNITPAPHDDRVPASPTRGFVLQNLLPHKRLLSLLEIGHELAAFYPEARHPSYSLALIRLIDG